VSGAGAPPSTPLDGSALRVAIVATRWYGEITDALLADALTALEQCRVRTPAVVRAPGAFELPVIARELASTHDAVVALGLVVRGGTPHFDYVCTAATEGLSRVATDLGVPIGFGLLTCDTMEQAHARSGLPGSTESKGAEAALAAVEAALVLHGLRHPTARFGF
jgi:6,7-dimethyl-8-ribityllumazine synthase